MIEYQYILSYTVNNKEVKAVYRTSNNNTYNIGSTVTVILGKRADQIKSLETM